MEDLKQKVRRDMELFNAGKYEEFVDGYSEDAEFTSPLGGTVKGRKAIAEIWNRNKQAFPDSKVTIDRIVAEGDTVAVEYTFSGTNTGALQFPSGETAPATNKKVTGPAVDIVVYKNGKVVLHRQYFDQVPGLIQLGLMPAPAGATA
jgi:steroid delta-isomerase-like uncharacterized protein